MAGGAGVEAQEEAERGWKETVLHGGRNLTRDPHVFGHEGADLMCSWHGSKMLEHGAQAVARQAHSPIVIT